MDSKELLNSLDFTKENINKQATIYSFTNVLSLSLVSGLGIECKLSENSLNKFVEELGEVINKTKDNKNKEEIKEDTILDTSVEQNASEKIDVDKDVDQDVDELFENINVDIESELNILKGLSEESEDDTEPEEDSKPTIKYLTKDEDRYSFLKDLKPIKAIYASSNLLSHFQDGFEDHYNTAVRFDLDNNNKIIRPKDQGLLILNEVKLGRLLHERSIFSSIKEPSEEEKIIGTILINLAISQIIFGYDYLKGDNGLFTTMKKTGEDDYDLVKVNDTINWDDQAYMLLAYAELYKTLKNPLLDNYHNELEAELIIRHARSLMNQIYKYEDEIISLPTSKLANFVSPALEALKVLDPKKKFFDFALSICDELSTREIKDGYLASKNFNSKPASMATHFKAVDALVSGSRYLKFDNFINSAENIYGNLDRTWNKSLGLFKINNDDDIKYTSKSIGYILKSLHKLKKASPSKSTRDRIQNQINTFFDSSVNDTELVTPPPGSEVMPMMRNENTIIDILETLLKDDKSYVFNKGFTMNTLSNKVNMFSTDFSSEYALYASDALLDLVLNVKV